ncbi:unnamed protein product [Lactuca saligna]|uniref:Uncharacterized protein n=1 Tax=Lactuca saligna TaxID=75948 RepID=A0AA35YM79_LACSI|nr:unnamed protein product [Lactuca saligna]
MKGCRRLWGFPTSTGMEKRCDSSFSVPWMNKNVEEMKKGRLKPVFPQTIWRKSPSWLNLPGRFSSSEKFHLALLVDFKQYGR